MYSKGDKEWDDGSIVHHVYWYPVCYGEFIPNRGKVMSTSVLSIQWVTEENMGVKYLIV